MRKVWIMVLNAMNRTAIIGKLRRANFSYIEEAKKQFGNQSDIIFRISKLPVPGERLH